MTQNDDDDDDDDDANNARCYGAVMVSSSSLDDMVNLDLTGKQRITANLSFTGLPMFSPDGRTLVFSSNSADASADWQE